MLVLKLIDTKSSLLQGDMLLGQERVSKHDLQSLQLFKNSGFQAYSWFERWFALHVQNWEEWKVQKLRIKIQGLWWNGGEK